MKKLEDIPKKQIFEVPNGYFEKLPAIIQTRVSQQGKEKSWWSYPSSLRLAVPVIVLLIAGFFWFSHFQSDTNAENILASIKTEDLMAYLSEAEVSTDELLESVTLDAQDVMNIEDSVYEFQVSDSEYEDILNEFE
jgi:hypothetical protein